MLKEDTSVANGRIAILFWYVLFKQHDHEIVLSWFIEVLISICRQLNKEHNETAS